MYNLHIILVLEEGKKYMKLEDIDLEKPIQSVADVITDQDVLLTKQRMARAKDWEIAELRGLLEKANAEKRGLFNIIIIYFIYFLFFIKGCCPG